ncbi:hypothetical protein [Planococcus sp. ISL-109]|uniref:hypothetical protein n=1 Tax=Planococcus sp. ISL-109 TaxID=2819166 RepID=UPI001BE7552E|nr:hypothetical protein [Planococcus sp. ISL-109]MBT2582618.1 hypothetical protein [Planococcus sp. ISL-109]
MTSSYEHIESVDSLSAALADPEVKQSIANLLHRLPELEKGIGSLEDVVDFGQTLLDDQPFIDGVESKLAIQQLDMETLAALLALLEKLPSLIAAINKVEESLAFVTAISQDSESLDYLTEQANAYAAPVMEEGRKGLTFIAAVKNKAEQDHQRYSIFSIFKWLKDPAVQKGFRYINATLETLNEKQAR